MMRASLPLLGLGLSACLPAADASGTHPPTPSPEAPIAAEPAAAEPAAAAVTDAAPDAPAPAAPAAPTGEVRTSARSLVIRTRAAPDAPQRGLTAEGGRFRVLGTVEGPGCASGWGQLEADGYLCLQGTEVVAEAPVPLPAMVSFDPPTPEEFESYMATGEYDSSSPELLTPAIYGKKWRRFGGKLYASIAALERGDAPVGQLTPGAGMKYRFEEIVETSKGKAITRVDGKVSLMNDIYLYPVDRRQGRDMVADALPEGMWPALTVDYEGAEIRSEPRADAPVIVTHPFHTSLVVERTPASADGHWWKIPDAGGPGVPGYADDLETLRHPMEHVSLPDGVKDDELWVDVELGQQTLMLRKGADLVYWTEVATGAPPMGTPLGTYRILAKYAYKDMQSRPDATDVYRVEDVPWTMIFRPAYALHAAYWHWGFGRVASHGCVNLPVKDAKYLFDHLGIGLPAGWLAIFPTAEESVVVRVRRGADVGRDRRAEFPRL
jgi:hypothetical protein